MLLHEDAIGAMNGLFMKVVTPLSYQHILKLLSKYFKDVSFEFT